MSFRRRQVNLKKLGGFTNFLLENTLTAAEVLFSLIKIGLNRVESEQNFLDGSGP